MEEIYIIKDGGTIVAAEPMDERDFTFSKGEPWDEEKRSSKGYHVRYPEGSVCWKDKYHFEQAVRKMTLKEAEMVAGGQFVIPDSSGSTFRPA